MKFYEIKQQYNNLQWVTVVYFRRKQDAEAHLKTLVETNIGKFQIFERTFSKLKDL